MGSALSSKLTESLERTLGGRLQGLVAELKAALVPELQAMTVQMERVRAQREEEEERKTVELEPEVGVVATRRELQMELELLRKEKDDHDAHLKSAATTKVHELVKLQNLLDHMRADNRVLQHQLNRYRERFREFKEAQNENVVDKLWGYWQYKPRSHLST